MPVNPNINNFGLLVTSGEHDGERLLSIGLAARRGTPCHPLPFEDAKLHPENYVFKPAFTRAKIRASKMPLETALSHKGILAREGIEAKLD
jgi:hypothetical protein